MPGPSRVLALLLAACVGAGAADKARKARPVPLETREFGKEVVAIPPGWKPGLIQKIEGNDLFEANFHSGVNWFDKGKPDDWAHVVYWRVCSASIGYPIPDYKAEARLTLAQLRDDMECRSNKFPTILGGHCSKQVGTMKVAGGTGLLFESDLAVESPEVAERILIFIASGRRYAIKFYNPAGRSDDYTPLLELLAANFKAK